MPGSPMAEADANLPPPPGHQKVKPDVVPPAPPGNVCAPGDVAKSIEAARVSTAKEEPVVEGEADIDKVYKFRDAILEGAQALGIETKSELVELFTKRAVDGNGEKVVPRTHFDDLLKELKVDAQDSSTLWICGHFTNENEVSSEGCGPVDVVGLLDYLQLTPEAEEQTILAHLHDELCEGATERGMATKEELCAWLVRARDATADDGSVDVEKLAPMARNLAEMVSNGVTPEGDAVDAGEFWSAVEMLDDSLTSENAPQARELIRAAYSNDDGSVDAAHLLHDLRLWPGVEEAERWHELADRLRSLLCSGAANHGIKTKEKLCELFADEEGHPKKMSVEDFVEAAQSGLGVDVAQKEDENEESEVLAFVRCFELSAEDDDEVSVEEDGLVDVGELLWKLLLWPGAEEEHRSLAAGRALRQDLLTHAEANGLETVGDLCALLVEKCDASETQVVPVGKLLRVLKDDFGCQENGDMAMYVRHFAAEDAVGLEKLLQHLELYDHGSGGESETDDEDEATVDA